MHVAINGWFVDQPSAGSGQYIAHLLPRLLQLDPQTRWSLLLPSHPDDPRKLDLNAVDHLHIERLPLPPIAANLAKLWWEQITVPWAAHRLRADVLWVPYWAAPFWQPLPVTVTVHDLIPALLPAYRGGFLQRLYTGLVSHTARQAAALITVSKASARDIVQHLHVPAERVQVVYHGPNQEELAPPDAAALAAVRHRYQLPARFFLYLGGFDVRKNVSAILHAYQRYLQRGGDPAVQLVLAGKLPTHDTPFAPDPRLLAQTLGLTNQVHFYDLIPEADKPAFYALATAFIFPSLYEGFGMMLLEAMQAGAPTLTSAE